MSRRTYLVLWAVEIEAENRHAAAADALPMRDPQPNAVLRGDAIGGYDDLIEWAGGYNPPEDDEDLADYEEDDSDAD